MGLKIPAGVVKEPLQVPPVGVGDKVTFGASIQTAKSGPASGCVGLMIVTTRVSELVQPFTLVNVYVSVKVPVPFGVKSPPEVTLVPVQVPPVGE